MNVTTVRNAYARTGRGMSESKEAFYSSLVQELRSLLHGEEDRVANAANASALLYERLSDVNWVGFYFLQDRDLLVGPFQGKPACVRIEPGKGVCGAAVQRRQVMVVPDVHAFPGHIACDTASRSEIVVPIADSHGNIVGVLDIDSPSLRRFDDVDAAGLCRVVEVFQEQTKLASSEFRRPT